MQMRTVMRTSNTARIILAACLAPAAPAVLMLIRGLVVGDHYAWWTFGLFLIPGYVAMLLVGLPLLILAKRKKWTLTVWRCVGFGALSGVISVLPVSAIEMLSGANPLSAEMAWALNFAGTAALAGVIAGIVFRVIAGPGTAMSVAGSG
jgi:hypothetical protein